MFAVVQIMRMTHFRMLVECVYLCGWLPFYVYSLVPLLQGWSLRVSSEGG